MYDVVVKCSRSLSHLLMSSCDYSLPSLIWLNRQVLFHYCRCCCNKVDLVDWTNKYYAAFVSSELAPNMFGASSEPASVMEFGFYSVQDSLHHKYSPPASLHTWALCLITIHLCALYVQLISTFCITHGFLLSLPRGRSVISQLKFGTTYPSILGFALYP